MVTRKFFTTLSADDKPWGVEINDVADLKTFLEVPGNWLANNVDMRCVLIQDFLIKIRGTAISPPAPGKMYLTGNSGTNVVMVFIPAGFFAKYIAFLERLINGNLVQPSIRPFVNPIIPDIQTIHGFLTGPIPSLQIETVIISETGAASGRSISHFSVTGGMPTSASARMILIAGYIFKMMGDPTYRQQILATNAAAGRHTVTYLDPNGMPNPPAILPKVTFAPFTSPGSLPIEYIGNDHSTLDACDMIVGTYDVATATITSEEGYIKTYA